MKKRTLWFAVILLLVVTVAVVASTSSKSGAKKPQRIPSSWGIYTDKVNGFSMRFPPGSEITVEKSDYPRKDVICVGIDLPGVVNWGGLGIEIVPNPKQLSAEAFYRQKLAVMDRETSGWGGSDDTTYQHSVSVQKQRGYARQYMGGDSLEKTVTLAWGDKAYEIGYTVEYTVMTDREKRDNPRRIELLEMMILSFQQQEQ